MLKRLATLFMTTLFLANIAIPNAKAEGEFPTEQFPYKEMQIQVMPEFDYPDNWPKDQPSLLVGNYGTYENKTGSDYNGEIEFPIPVNDKNFQIYLVAEFPAADKPEVQRPFEINKEKGVVTWKPSKAIKKDGTYQFVVEYYTNPFEAGDTKKFNFEYVNPADVEKLDIIMYAPLNAKNFNTDPKAANTSKSDYGEELYYYQYTNQKKGNSVKIATSYTKKDNESTLSLINKQNPPDDANHSGTTATDQVANGSTDNSKKAADQPIIGIGGASVIGVSLIIAGLFVFFGLKGNARGMKPTMNSNKKAQNKTVVQKSNKKDKSDQKTSKNDTTDQKKKLRSLLLSGKIDDETYENEMKKLG